MRRENPRWEYRRETSAYDKSDYRSKFYKGKWEKTWIKDRIQYALDKKIDLYESMWEGYIDKTEHGYEKATNKLSKKKMEQYDKILKLMDDGDWHKTAEIAENLGLKDTRTKEC